MRDLSWYIKRLSIMDPGEVAFRVSEQINLHRMRLKNQFIEAQWPTGKFANYKCYSFCNARKLKLPALSWDNEIAEREISCLLDGNYRFMGKDWKWEFNTNCWHVAPDTGRQWPVRFFASIPYRKGNPYGDVRVAWEPSRLQQLVRLALIANHSDDNTRFAVLAIESQIESWMRANLPLSGIHYISAMECALRILSLCHTLDMVRTSLVRPDVIWPYLLCLIEQHADFILKRLSLHSSTGNHTVAEAVGLIYAGSLFPEFNRSVEWKSTGLKLLCTQADRQILPDGGGVEQSFWYHVFVVELFKLAEEVLRHCGQDIPERISAATERGIRFLNTLCDSRENLPSVGDSDSGYALSPLLEIVWRKKCFSQTLTTFPESGYSLICRGVTGLKVLFDHGPLGMEPSFGHGHADALSILAWWRGKPIFIDPGTYTYTGDMSWRNYFRSTRAHNTICVDRLDQARQEGPFMWSSPFRSSFTKVISSDPEYVVLLASHDGYQHLGVTHVRIIAVHDNAIIVWDRVLGTGEHKLSLCWHLRNQVLLDDDMASIKFGNDTCAIKITGGKLKLHKGDDNAGPGWFSAKYGEKQPASSLEVYIETTLPHEFTTTISFGDSKLDSDLIEAHIKEMKRLVLI